jgi:hypothetical protein
MLGDTAAVAGCPRGAPLPLPAAERSPAQERGRREGSVAKFLKHTTCRNTEELKLQHIVYNKMLRSILRQSRFSARLLPNTEAEEELTHSSMMVSTILRFMTQPSLVVRA